MAKVTDFHTHARLDNQDTAKNDKLVNEGGIYIGCLPKDDADFMRVWQDRLIIEKNQIVALTNSFARDYTQYLHNVGEILSYFKIDPALYDPELHELTIGEDGNTWMLKREQQLNK